MSAHIDNYKQSYNSKTYNVGIYLRLSREDENGSRSESESIVNQKNFLTRVVLENGWNLVEIYCDDGYTGTSFDRPDFKRLIRDIERNRINLVITKDLSRLGRDYIQTGYYLEQYFPQCNVRYIAVNDGIDTFADNNSNNDMSPFRSVLNDLYAKDISKKVRTTMNIKRQNGEFIGAFAAYGYSKHPEDRNKLIIDEEAAAVVKRVFDLYINGSGFSRIARLLNDECIPPPSAYKSALGNYKNAKARFSLWTHETIKKILINPTYAGNLTQRKYLKVNYKINKLRNIPKEQWITVPDTHEPIISIESFELVQNMISKKVIVNNVSERAGHLLTGLLFCGDCGEKMTYSKTPSAISYCICSKYKRFGQCSRHPLKESELEQAVLKELRSISQYAIDEDKLLKEASHFALSSKNSDMGRDITNVTKRLEEIKKIIKSLYEDKLKGMLTQEDFLELSGEFNNERDRLNKRLSQLAQKSAEIKEIHSETYALIRLVKDFMYLKNVNKSILSKLIYKIEIFENQKINIHYKFKKPF